MNRAFFIIITLSTALSTAAAEPDSTMADTMRLREVIITNTRAARPTIPVQTLSGDQLRRLNSNSVADALRYFAGVQVKDYGGVGGIKTVNVRSMGSHHTGVVYDGVALGNAQNGQIDLGQFSLDNVETISLHNGQRSALLQPARDFGNAATVYMRTRMPHFENGKRVNVRTALRFGSFDLISPSALVEYRISQRVNASASVEYLNSSGKYHFRYRKFTPNGTVAWDTTAQRKNGDIESIRTEVNVNGTTSGGDWRMKIYNYTSERGVPGAIVNNVWRRGERIWDNNTFVQGSFGHSTSRWSTLANAKFAYYATRYVNNDERVVKIDNHYRQREAYFSTANLFTVARNWWASASYDFQWNNLSSDMRDFSRPDRFTNMVSVASAYDAGRLRVQASILGTFITDKIKGQATSRSRHAFTPAVYITGQPLNRPWLNLRAFYKKSFRMPTFNDLYYTDIGNSALSPERVSQYDIGTQINLSPSKIVKEITLSADAYYNYVTDKIVAYPKGQQFRWTMLNLGKVDIRGVDAIASVSTEPISGLMVAVRGQYTFQRAIDITDRRDTYYRHQIPYVPHHSGTAVLNVGWRNWNLNYSYIYVGERFSQQENIASNYCRPWYTHDLSLSRDIALRRINLRLQAEVNNLLGQDYDVIANYPMPRRNVRFSIVMEL